MTLFGFKIIFSIKIIKMAKTKKNEETLGNTEATVPTEMTKAQKNDFLATAIAEAEEFTNNINLLVREHQASLPAGVTLVASYPPNGSTAFKNGDVIAFSATVDFSKI